MKSGPKFLLRFLIAVVVLYAIVAAPPVNDRVIVPYTAAVARASAALCRASGMQVRVHNTIMFSDGGFGMDVENGCNGVEAAVLLFAALIAFPATLAERAAGLISGFLLVQVLNVLRLWMLYWLGVYHRRWYDLFHVTVWQTIVIVIALGFFLLWSSRIANRRAATAAR